MKSIFDSVNPKFLHSPQNTIRSGIYLFNIFVVLNVLFLFISCNNNPSSGGSGPDAAINGTKVHMAMAGGGWRAHTGHSGWTISLLNGNRTLSEAFTNVESVSSNSGGSWFSTMLMYSDSFVNDIEAPNAAIMWDSTGWLGQQKHLFGQVACQDKSWWEYFPCVLDHIEEDSVDVGYWNTLVEDIVYQGYPISLETKLSSQHQPWSINKPLLLAASLLTNGVVLKDTNSVLSGYDKRYYQACISPAKPVTDGSKGGSCSWKKSPYVTPVTFSSIPEGSSLKPLPFLSAIGSEGSIQLGYSISWHIDSKEAPFIETEIQNPQQNDQVPVITAAAASSAAIGFGAMEPVANSIPVDPLSWETAYYFEDEALSFQLENSKVQFMDAKGMSLDTLAKRKVVRIADGGPVDNSGVAQLVRFLQINEQDSGFNIIAFDNVETPFIPNSGANVGTDIAYLFGKGLTHGNQFCGTKDEFCVDVPHLQIFDSTALKTTSTWHFNGDSTQELIYTKYTVSTKDNPNFGISSGSTGTLHAFTCVWPGASTAPYEYKAFNAYAEMFDFINTSLLAKQGEGLGYLEGAFGIE